MAVLIASDLHKDMAGKPLLGGVSFKLERRERMTLAGRNGAGKTTLLRMLAGETSIDRGELSVAKGVRIALHDQRPPRERGMPLREYLLSGCAEELAIEAELSELEGRMAGGADDDGLLARYARAQARLEARGGYLWRDRATVMARGLGFAGEDLDRALSTFSGGQLTRASLARALATGADVLLLDEPTNHLDIESLEWLEQTLVELDAAVVLVAHDRWFLEAVGTAVLELHGGPPSRSRFFAGTWHNWRKEQAAKEIALGKAVDSQRAEIERMERFIERFRYKATKARQAQSRVKKLAKIERIEREPNDAKGLEFTFSSPERSGRVIFELLDGRIEVGGDGKVQDGVQPSARSRVPRSPRRLRSCCSSTSNCGSSAASTCRWSAPTEPARRPSSRRSRGGGSWRPAGSAPATTCGSATSPSTPTSSVPAASAGQSVLEATQRASGLNPGRARALLGRFLFSGEDAEKPLNGLSGGERRRLSLALLVGSASQPPNVLILDEPTNHLDLESREALEDALRSFQGAILLVSHDRALLDAVGTRTVAVEDRALHSYIGGWAEYVRVRDERRAALASGAVPSGGALRAGAASSRTAANGSGPDADGAVSSTADSAPGTSGKRKHKPKPKGPSKNRLTDQRKAEQAVEAAEAGMRALEEELADPAAWATQYEAAKSEARHTAARRAVEDAYTRLEALID